MERQEIWTLGYWFRSVLVRVVQRTMDMYV